MTKLAQEITFREAQGTDAPAFLEFMQIVAGETDFLVMEEGGLPLTEQEMAAILSRTEEAYNQLCLLALAGSDVVGAITIHTPHQEKLSHIGDVFLAVRQAYWGQGLGRILLEEVCDWARDYAGLARLELTVQCRNQAAVHLYQSVGFDIEGTKQRGARSKEGEWLDLYYMGKLVDKDDTR